ncbi:Nuclear speckle splicing regulatory protein 1 -like protein [Toxocara canis]|uniref:Nuclear speckle splicing regulatory protein 1-like protein n=1 Tax=Toxocara canis TaxID=6265 RepID=A0A0B2V4T7_TOXCA|nr:Nuclear speckle splicing regulatory protein 1 -like protein [Toxocara canis]
MDVANKRSGSLPQSSASTDRHHRSRRDRKQDEQESRGNERGHHEEEHKRAQKEEDKDKKVEADMEKKTKPATKEERLEVIKKLLKQRNTDKDIAEFRRRYLERKESGSVTIPV